MPRIPRTSTGIEGLDTLLQGGVPDDSTTLLLGSYGCGKTITSLQYLWHGLRNGENALFISLEQTIDDIVFDAETLGWELDDYRENDQLEMAYLSPDTPERGFLGRVKNTIKESDADRIVVDTVSVMLAAQAETDSERRSTMYELYRALNQADATSLVTAEARKRNTPESRYGVAEYVCDGVLALYYTAVSDASFRNIEVRKMRNTNYRPGSHPLTISDDGIVVKPTTDL